MSGTDLDLHDILGDCSDESVTESSEAFFPGAGTSEVAASPVQSPDAATPEARDQPYKSVIEELKDRIQKKDDGNLGRDASHVQSPRDLAISSKEPALQSAQAEDSEDSAAESSDVSAEPDGTSMGLRHDAESSGTSDSASDSESVAGCANPQPTRMIEISPRSPGSGAQIGANHDSSDTDSGGDFYVPGSPASSLAAKRPRAVRTTPGQQTTTEPTDESPADAMRLVAVLLGEAYDSSPDDEASLPELQTATSSPPSPAAAVHANAKSPTHSSRLRALEATPPEALTEAVVVAALSPPREALGEAASVAPAVACLTLPSAPPCESEEAQSSLCSRSVSPTSIIQDTAGTTVGRRRCMQPAENSEDESVVDHDFLFTTPEHNCGSPAAVVAARRPLPGPPAGAAAPEQSQSHMLRPAAGTQASHQRNFGSATRQLVRELSRGPSLAQEEQGTGMARASQRHVFSEAAAAFKEAAMSASTRRLAPIPSSSSAYEPLGEPEPTRVWHTPDAPGLWIRHDAPMSESPIVTSDCPVCEAAGGERDASKLGSSHAEVQKSEDFDTSYGNEAGRGITFKASWLEDTPAQFEGGPVERAMQSLLLDKASVSSAQARTASPGDGRCDIKAKTASPGDGRCDGQVQVFASLRNSARAKLLGAVAPETACHANVVDEPSATTMRQRGLEPQIALCPSLPRVPQLRQEATSSPSSVCGLVSPPGASLPPRAGIHERLTAAFSEDPASVPRLTKLSLASPSPVRLRSLPSVITPEPRRLCSHSASRDGADSSTLGDIAQLFETPAGCSSVTSVGGPETSVTTRSSLHVAPGPTAQYSSKHSQQGASREDFAFLGEKSIAEATLPDLHSEVQRLEGRLLGARQESIARSSQEMLCAASEMGPSSDVIARSVRQNPAAASCNSCIARAHKQVGQMRKQLQDLAAACDTLEGMAAPLRAPLQQAASRKVQPTARAAGVAAAAALDVSGGGHDRNCLGELASAHANAMRAAAAQLTAVKHSRVEDSHSVALEGTSLKRLRAWVAEIIAECRGRGPPCWAIAGMLEAAVEAIAQGTHAPKMQFCNVVEAQAALPHCRQQDFASQGGGVRANPCTVAAVRLCDVACGR